MPHRDDVKLSGVDVFKNYLALYERADALQRIRVMRLADGDTHTIDQPEPVYTAGAGANAEFDTGTLRYGYTSLVTPTSTYDYDIDARKAVVSNAGGRLATTSTWRALWATAPTAEGGHIGAATTARPLGPEHRACYRTLSSTESTRRSAHYV